VSTRDAVGERRYPAAARLNGTTRPAGACAGGVATAAGRAGATIAAGFRSTAQPGDRFPQWTHRRKIWPGSHHMP
jgi:hypothetical protein